MMTKLMCTQMPTVRPQKLPQEQHAVG